MDPVEDLPILLVIGGAVLGGSLGARLFQRLRIPQVVGYIVVGLLLGKSGLHLITDRQLDALSSFNYFALGVIGFMIGGELHRRVFKKHGRQLLVILLAEGMGAFLLVSGAVSALTYAITGNVETSVAFGLILGAISSATAPAATVDVLWEHKTKGILTTTVLAIVALDDGLGLLLYSLASTVAMRLTGIESGSAMISLLRVCYEIGGAVLLGMGTGVILSLSVRRITDQGRTLASIVGLLTFVLGAALWMDVDIILAAMALGVTVVNMLPHRSRETFNVMERFAPPIYVLFFVLVGARLSIGGLPMWMWSLALVYVAGRSVGKISGAWLGARWTGAAASVRRYLGLCLFSQAGVAIGLSILASMRFAGHDLNGMDMGSVILMVITATTFLVQIIGPPCVKTAVDKAGEIGLNVTEEDLIRDFTVGAAADTSAPVFRVDTPATQVLQTVSDTTSWVFPIVNRDEELVGILSLHELRSFFADPSMGEWLVAFDFMVPAPDSVTEDTPLAVALAKMKQLRVEYLPVVSSDADRHVVGIIENLGIQRTISRELLRRRQAAGEDAAEIEETS